MAYLARNIEQAHVLWFEKSNQWVQLDDPQWFIFNLYVKETSREEALPEFLSTYPLPEDEARGLIGSSYDSFQKLFQPDFQLPSFDRNTTEASTYSLTQKKIHHYSFLEKQFSIAYGSPFLEEYIHLPLSHLEDTVNENSRFVLELFRMENLYVLRTEGRCLTAEEPGQIKRLLYIELTNLFYEKTDKDWMTLIHGSAVSMNSQLLVLSSAGGSGKSTMAGLLRMNGFNFFSDDFIPVEAASLNAYPFPAALCIKDDAIRLLESLGMSLERTRSHEMAYAAGTSPENEAAPAQVRSLIFIQYKKGSGCTLSPVSTLEALQRFLQEAWVGNDMERAGTFIDWFPKLSFYKLEYGNNEEAIALLRGLMEK